jgi:hypothetical protein
LAELAESPVALDEPASDAVIENERPRELPSIADEAGQEADNGDEGVSEDDLDELDFGFKKYQVPKSLKEGVEKLRAEFTQKTQSAPGHAGRMDEYQPPERRAGCGNPTPPAFSS